MNPYLRENVKIKVGDKSYIKKFEIDNYFKLKDWFQANQLKAVIVIFI